MRRTLGAVLLALAAATPPVFALRLPIRSYGSAEGLLDAGVNRVRVGPDGLVWIATLGGLWRFDGERFDVLGPAEGVPRKEVYDFAFAADGSLWIAGEAGLFHGSPARVPAGRSSFSEVRLGEGGARELPHRVAPAPGGAVWVGTFGGLWRVTDRDGVTGAERLTLATGTVPEIRSRVQALAVDASGSIWVGTHTQGVYRVRAGGQVDHLGGDVAGCEFVRAFAFDAEGGVWTAYLGGVARFDGAAFGVGAVARFVLTPKDGLPGIDTAGLLAAGPDTMLLASSAGITEIGRDRAGRWAVVRTIDRRWGLPGDFVSSLDRDEAGNLFIGLAQGGLAKEVSGGFVEQDDAEGPGTRIVALGHDRDGRLAVLAQAGGRSWTLRIVARDRTETHRLAPADLGYVGWGLRQLMAQEANGTWWVVSGNGVLRYGGAVDGGRRLERPPDAVIDQERGLPGRDVYLLFLDTQGDVWTSTHSLRPGVSTVARLRHAGGAVETFPTGEIGSARLAVGFAEDRGHNVWIAFEDGALVRHDAAGGFTRVDSPLGPLAAAPFLVDTQGRLWILGDGVALVERPEDPHPAARRYDLPADLRGLSYTCGVDDGTGTLYLCSQRGVVRLTPGSDRVRLFTAADGLVGGVVQMAARDTDGVLWFSDESGLSRFEPGPDPPVLRRPARIRAVRIAGAPVPVAAVGAAMVGPLTLEPAQRTVAIDFFAVHHGPGEPPRFQHRLEGAETDWSAASDDRSVLYAGIAPGRYRFAVRAVAADGTVISDPAVVELRVLAPVWRRGWFVALAAVMLAALAYAVHRARIARLVAIERVRARIATDLHDEVGSSLSQISVLSQVAEREAVRAAGASPAALSRITDLAREVVEVMGETVWAISPREDRLGDLVHRMRRYGLDLFADGDAGIRLDLPGGDLDGALDPEVRRTLYLVFKEALHNARKHAAARVVEVALRRLRGGFELRVRDDGRGFDPAATSRGHGLAGMRRRAASVGGRIEVRTAPGQGTEIVVTIPASRRNLFQRTVPRG